ncbi:unnamed protein product [Echinostoma caproni]|uniref:Fibronectin type-III domain-containing protein n=1 Tax=Echinostoma caproni TaxID=27848 RepID=A0A183ABX6_9TREM|nr:unnamed protein product [Echinostoma caproni]
MESSSSERVENRKESVWKAGSIWVEPFPGENSPPNHTVSSDETALSNSQQSRVHYSRINYYRDTMNIRLFGKRGDAFLVRVSTRSSPTHMFDGYPIPAQSSGISVCVQSKQTDVLEVRWNPALTDSMRPVYCIAVNTEQNLPYRCSAMARLRPLSDGQFHRPQVFRETDHLRLSLIESSVYQCVNTTRARIKLPPKLVRFITSSGSSSVGKKLYVNVYVINPRTELSSSYAPSIEPIPIRLCHSIRAPSHIPVRVNATPTYLAWNAEVIFDWPTTDTSPPTSTIPSAQLFFQPCQLAKSNQDHYTLHLFKVKQTNSQTEKELFQVVVNSSQIIRVTNQLHPGSYRLYMDGSAAFKSGEHVARFFILGDKSNLLPKRPHLTAFRWLSHDLRRPVLCLTSPGQTQLTLFTPAHDRADYPRYYYLAVYTAHGNDHQGRYQELLVQAVLDACMITVDSCYQNRQATCSLVYPDHYPANFNSSIFQGFSLFQSIPSVHQPSCSFG